MQYQFTHEEEEEEEEENAININPPSQQITRSNNNHLSYISNNPLPSLKGLKGDNIRNTIRIWLFTFHNSVRVVKDQPIIVNTVEECQQYYNSCFIKRCEYDLFIQNGAYAVRLGWVKLENWRKWYTTSEKLRITIGNVVL